MSGPIGMRTAIAIGVAPLILGPLILGLAALARGAEGQQPAAKTPRIGVLLSAPPSDEVQAAFRSALRERGWVEGRSVAVEWRSAERRADLAATLAAELAASGVDAIVAVDTLAVRAARDATATVPIVMAPGADPVSNGFASSLARPDRNVTGVAELDAELQGRRIELLREAIPRLARVGLLVNLADPFARPYVEQSRVAAERSGVELRIIDAHLPQEVDTAFAAMAAQRVDAVMVQRALTGPAWRSAELALRHRLPSLSGPAEFAEAGGLIAYSSRQAEPLRRAAHYVDRILKGAKPAELPIEEPTVFDLTVNLTTAAALGMTIPPSVSGRASRVIQ